MMQIDNEITLKEAIEFARWYHEPEQPGYVDDHVLAVLRGVQQFNVPIDVQIATILHDLFEDTQCRRGMVLEQFGHTVYVMVEAVTDEEGKNRKERKWKTYNKIRRSRYTVLIKLMDRIDNLRRCLRDPLAKYSTMYLAEDHTFRSALWEPMDWVDAWDTYFDLIELLHKQIARKTTAA